MTTTNEQSASEQSAAREQNVSHKQAAARAAAKIWNVIVEPDGPSAAHFLNIPPAQQAGEGFVSLRRDGRMDVYFFL